MSCADKVKVFDHLNFYLEITQVTLQQKNKIFWVKCTHMISE